MFFILYLFHLLATGRPVLRVDNLKLHIYQNNVEFFQQFGLEDTSWTFSSPEILNCLFLYPNENLTFSVHIYPDGNSTYEFDAAIRRLLTKTLSSLSQMPHILLRNSTIEKDITYSYDPLMDRDHWKVIVPYDEVIQQDGRSPAIFPTEEWSLSLMTGGAQTNLLDSQATLIDTDRTFVLLWNLGTPVSRVPVDVIRSLRDIILHPYPCAVDVALLGLVHNSSNKGIYLARTSVHFWAPSIEWFDLSCSLTQCSNNCPKEGCGDLKLIDYVLTNWHLLILTDNGLFVSNSMAPVSQSEPRTLQFTKITKFAAPSVDLSDAVSTGLHLHYTPVCITSIDQILVEQVGLSFLPVKVTKMSGRSTWVSVLTCHSVGPFDKWHCFTTVTLPDIVSVKSLVFNEHVNVVIFLAQTATSGVKIYTLAFQQDTGDYMLVSDGAALSTDLDQLYIHPFTYTLYATGQQVHLSRDNGNSFEPVYTLPAGDSVKKVFVSTTCDIIYMLSERGKLLFGRAGVSRLVQVDPKVDQRLPAEIYMTHRHHFYIVRVDDTGQIVRTPVDTQTLIKDARIRSNHPFAIQLLSDSRAIVHEHMPLSRPAPGTDSELTSEPVLEQFVYGMRLDAKQGGSAVIVSVQNKHKVSGFLGYAEINILSLFVYETLTQTPAQDHTIALIVEKGKTFISLRNVTSVGSKGWKRTDIGKTVVLPYGYSYLLTSFVNETSMEAKCVVVNCEPTSVVYPVRHWHVYDLTNTDFKNFTWELRENECQHVLTPGDKHLISSKFQLDTRVQATFSLSLSVIGFEPIGTQGQLLLATFTNPQDYSIVRDYESSLYSQRLQIRVVDKQHKKATTYLVFHVPATSLRCPTSTHRVVLYSTCPFNRHIVYHYPNFILVKDFISGNPLDKYNRPLLMNLPVNYRPPSAHGILIPVNDYIYNADPSKHRYGDFYSISRKSGKFHWCAHAKSREDCNCTDEIKMSSLVKFTDCKERAYRLILPAKLELKFTLDEPDSEPVTFTAPYIVSLSEVNNRIDFMVEAGSNKNLEAFKRHHATRFYNPDSITIYMRASGLYHFRVSVVPTLSFCNLTDELQVYVDSMSLRYPMQYVLTVSIAIGFGGILFGIYQWYLMTHHRTRVKRSGPLCLDPRDFWYGQSDATGCCQPCHSEVELDGEAIAQKFNRTGLHIRHSYMPVNHDTVRQWLEQQQKMTSLSTLERFDLHHRQSSGWFHRRKSSAVSQQPLRTEDSHHVSVGNTLHPQSTTTNRWHHSSH